MGFLDNSGDIILDAVLTDLGRERLARGDGSFRIARWSPGDPEINYALYDNNHLSGTAYYDLKLLQTPVLSANSYSGQEFSKCVTVARNNLWYLPILKQNTNTEDGVLTVATTGVVSETNSYWITVDQDTSKLTSGTTELRAERGVLDGSGILGLGQANTSGIVIDQGLDTTDIPITNDLSPELVETQYLVMMDSRLGTLAGAPWSNTSGRGMQVNFVDDDRIGSWYLSLTTNPNYVTRIPKVNPNVNPTTVPSSIRGPYGTRLSFALLASQDLRMANSTLFNRLGTSTTNPTINGNTYTGTFLIIDSMIKIIGMTTGYQINIPIRLAKLSS